MPVIRNIHIQSEQAYLDHYLPEDHNDQDIIYLKKRYQWIMSEIPYPEVSKTYTGTTFSKR